MSVQSVTGTPAATGVVTRRSIPQAERQATPMGGDDVRLSGATAAAPSRAARAQGGSLLGMGRRVALALALALTCGTAMVCTANAQSPDCPAQVAQTSVASHDFGSAKDVSAVKHTLKTSFGEAGDVSVSHDWALARAYTPHAAVSVILHRTGDHWTVKDSDGGVYVASMLQDHGVPNSDVLNLLRLYK